MTNKCVSDTFFVITRENDGCFLKPANIIMDHEIRCNCNIVVIYYIM